MAPASPTVDVSRKVDSAFDRRLIRSVHLVPVTAFDESGKLDLTTQGKHLQRMYASGVRVYMPAAGTSEFHSLTPEEIVALVRVTRESTGPDAQIFAPVGYQVGTAQDVAERSLAAGATGIMFMPFAHPYMSNAGARDYYIEVMEKVPCPTLIYKKSPIPSDALLLELASMKQVVGVKYAENNMHDFRRVVQADGDRIEWLCGSAERFAPYYMLAGATGYTTGAGNLCPYLTLAMHAAFAAGEFREGMRLQALITPIEDFRAREGDSFNISMLKYAMRHLGLEFGPARAPQRRLSDSDRHEIDRMLAPILAAERELAEEAHRAGL